MEDGNHNFLGAGFQHEEGVVFYITCSQNTERELSGDIGMISLPFTKCTVTEIHPKNVVFFSPFSYFLSLEKASESNKDPGDLYHPLHPGRLHCLCDHSCSYLQTHRGMDSLGVHLLCGCHSDYCWLWWLCSRWAAPSIGAVYESLGS